jgi:hypothetical protein
MPSAALETAYEIRKFEIERLGGRDAERRRLQLGQEPPASHARERKKERRKWR